MLLKAVDPIDPRYTTLPYDYFCPSIRKDGKLEKMVCKTCGVHFATQVARKGHHCLTSFNNSLVIFEDELTHLEPIGCLEIPVIKNLADWLQPVYSDLNETIDDSDFVHN